jgi:hypothetical protein
MQARLLTNARAWKLATGVQNAALLPGCARAAALTAAAPRRQLWRAGAAPEGHSISELTDPANSIVSPAPGLEEAQPLVTQFEAREDEDRETFVTAEGLVQEVEEEDAEVSKLLLLLSSA